jgi:soluble lytic murein transglycosylase-like protein
MRNSRATRAARELVNRSGFWQWQYDGESAALPRPLFGTAPASAIVGQWEKENRPLIVKRLYAARDFAKRHAFTTVLLAVTFLLGAALASGPQSAAVNLQLRDQIRRTNGRLTARQGELALVRMENSRLNSIFGHSKRYGVPADMAASIYDIAIAEGIDPKIAFALVSVESEFSRKAISPKGAVGLTQLMPATAKGLKPNLVYNDLFDRDTNLRLGFRFLNEMLRYYKGDLNLALTAYNRGPATVDGIRKAGGDPSNGYAEAIMSGGLK